RPVGPGRLYLCVDEGSEVHRVGVDGTRLVHRRTATPAEEAALDRAARVTVDALARRDVPAAVVPRLNRRAIDLAPGTEEPAAAPAGVTVLGGGPARFLALLADQLERRRRGDVPDVDDTPDWTLTVDGLDPDLERVHETLLAIADGRLGTRGTPLLAHPATDPGVRAAGVYAGTGADSELAGCPDWTTLPGTVSDP